MKLKYWLACGAAFVALPTAVFAQGASEVESVVVTGSRVISDAANSPTPLTVVSTADLLATTPTDIPDGLNKLPVFQGSQTLGRPGDGSRNNASNTLNLRNFGAQRTLVLLDGHRAAPSNSDGTVDIDTLPQGLISRVDVVTGGASAVYGSDAVTGVVNFILDKKFDGVKFDINSGLSTYADAMSYNLSAVAGTALFGGRGHFEGSLEYRHRDPVNQSSRPYGPPANYGALAGTGSVANPYNYIANGRRPNSAFGGLIQGCVPACNTGSPGVTGIGANGQYFIANGILAPFNPGVSGATDAKGNPTAGTGNLNSGGDGVYSPYGQMFNGYHQASAFGRFSYDLADNVTWYVQCQGSEAYSFGWYFPQKIQPGTNQADIFYKDNPFLSPAIQAQLGNNGTHPLQTSGSVQPGNTFQLGEFITSLGQTGTNATGSVNRVLSVQTGLDGTVLGGRFTWNLFYTHAENRLQVDLVNNQNLQHMYAAQDAVQLPNGNVACYAATQAATKAQYANCVPVNPFGPTAISQSAFNYIFETTAFHETDTLDNFGGAISGDVFEGWGAGAITAALSGEMRFNAYDIGSNVPSSTFVDCTGLRICNPALPSYAQPILQSIHASQNVWEVALETNVPVIKDVPLIQALDLNLAGRYTDYSVSGSVQTWKIGFNWNVVDSFRFRGTTSIDIRAPTLDDLFRPATLVQNVFNGDLHIPDPNKPQVPNPQYVSYTTTYSSQGNPNLVPEVSRTYTVGAVWTPDFIPGLTVSLDYYRIHLANAIGSIAPGPTIQSLCEASGGTSIYCNNYQRPLPFSDHTVANETTRLYTFNLNTASTRTEGWDFESNYAWQMSDIVENWQGSWTGRLLATYQPVINNSILFPGAPFTRSPSPSTRVSAQLNYTLNDWKLGIQDSWVSGFSQVGGPVTATINNWVNPHVNSWNQVDMNISRNFALDGADMTGYFVVQNLFNAQPAYIPNGTIGQWYPTFTSGYSVQSAMGRYFTLGLRANL
jgi:outer membrane receptor protein involved in Fe transport